MKLARIGVLGVGAGAAIIAAILAKNLVSSPEGTKQVESPKFDTVPVLVANDDIRLGSVISSSAVRWQDWPKDAVSGRYVTRDAMPTAVEDFAGSAVRAPILSGEPIIREKLVRREDGGVLSAILPSGMRAISVKISPETGAGGFILPNDRVDVILTRRDRDSNSGKEVHRTETILNNVRVLAIDQTIQEDGKEQVVIGKTATLELRPSQAEILALAEARGTISLALRSLADSRPQDGDGSDGDMARRRSGTVTVVRYGVQSSVEMVR